MTSVRKCWDHYVQHHLGKTCEAAANKRRWNQLSWFADLAVEDLTPMEVDRYVEHRGVGPATVNRELALLRAALKHSYRHGLIRWAPEIKTIPGAKPKLRSLTAAEAERLVRAADEGNWREQVYVRLALGTGARPGATVSLQWSQVHSKVIDFRVASALSHRMKGRAVVPINGMVRAALKIAAEHRNGDYILHWYGRRMSSPRPLMQRLTKRAKIKNCSPHVLRHTVVSVLLSQGEDLLKVSRLIGHANSKTTEATYFQHPPEWLKSLTDQLDF